MSFLNPVNEPVLRFKSTDAGAPQINYNARVAGDVKAVIKACLVTGYGATASAGWSIANEVNHVAEFVSPSVAMSDYRLGIDDTSVSSTTWYYQYQDVRTSTAISAPPKDFSQADKLSGNNGWQLLVTLRGFYFIEIVQSRAAKDKVARLTYFGQVKSALSSADTKNMAFWHLGFHSGRGVLAQVLGNKVNQKGYNIAGNTGLQWSAANLDMLGRSTANWDLSSVEMTADLYLHVDGRFAGQHPGILLQDRNASSSLFGVYDTTVQSRPVLAVAMTWEVDTLVTQTDQARHALIYLDYWEY